MDKRWPSVFREAFLFVPLLSVWGRSAGKPARPKSVTYVLGTLCCACLRAGPAKDGEPGGPPRRGTPDPHQAGFRHRRTLSN